MNNTDEKTPSSSLAASCVRLTLVNDDDEKDDDERFTFRPVYTHQLFPDEVVRGYQPFPEDDVVVDDDETRSSIRRRATHRLRVSIRLAPSCRSCRVRTETEEIRTTTTTTEDANGDAEKRALDDDDDAPPAAKRSRTVGFVDVATSDGAASPPSSAAVSARLSLDEIVAALRRALPPVVVDDDDAVDVEHDRLTAPIGEVVERYRVEGDEHEYVVSIADGGATAAYHRAVQNLALWFVETAEPVDVDRVDDGGYWRVLYLFRTSSSERPTEKNNDAETTTTRYYSFAGYCTLYHFRAPFRRPTPGTVARICQILVLPPFQRAGHGRRLVERAYDAARDDDDVVEINVEDPSPAFARLRDAVDADRLAAAERSDDDDDDVVATERRTTELAAALGVTRTQVARAREIRRLRRLVGDDGDPTVTDDVRERTFRIAVKRRLLRTRAEELGAVEGGREAQKKRLGELYDELRAHYGAVLARTTKR